MDPWLAALISYGLPVGIALVQAAMEGAFTDDRSTPAHADSEIVPVEIARCERCRSDGFWQVRVRDTGGPAGGELSPDHRPDPQGDWQNGALEALICRHCGTTRWIYVKAHLDPMLSRQSMDCPACDDREGFRVAQLEERGAGGERVAYSPDGKRSVTLMISRCGHVEWYAPDLDGSSSDGTSPSPCLACGRADRSVVPVAQEQGDAGRTPLRPDVASWAATFSLQICRGCALVEWTVENVSRLKPGREVRRIRATKAAFGRRVATSRPVGPYR